MSEHVALLFGRHIVYLTLSYSDFLGAVRVTVTVTVNVAKV